MSAQKTTGTDPAEAPTDSAMPISKAMSAVMAEVQSVKKDQRNEDQRYNFRGVDAVVNAVGPILRKHRVLVFPVAVTARYRDVQTSRGKPSRECTVDVTYRFLGPAGDHVEVAVPGESMDSSDKGTAKAMSVAYRICLLQTFCIPTDDPDPDQHNVERAYGDPLKEAKGNAWRATNGRGSDEERTQLIADALSRLDATTDTATPEQYAQVANKLRSRPRESR